MVTNKPVSTSKSAPAPAPAKKTAAATEKDSAAFMQAMLDVASDKKSSSKTAQSLQNIITASETQSKGYPDLLGLPGNKEGDPVTQVIETKKTTTQGKTGTQNISPKMTARDAKAVINDMYSKKYAEIDAEISSCKKEMDAAAQSLASDRNKYMRDYYQWRYNYEKGRMDEAIKEKNGIISKRPENEKIMTKAFSMISKPTADLAIKNSYYTFSSGIERDKMGTYSWKYAGEDQLTYSAKDLLNTLKGSVVNELSLTGTSRELVKDAEIKAYLDVNFAVSELDCDIEIKEIDKQIGSLKKTADNQFYIDYLKENRQKQVDIKTDLTTSRGEMEKVLSEALKGLRKIEFQEIVTWNSITSMIKKEPKQGAFYIEENFSEDLKEAKSNGKMMTGQEINKIVEDIYKKQFAQVNKEILALKNTFTDEYNKFKAETNKTKKNQLYSQYVETKKQYTALAYQYSDMKKYSETNKKELAKFLSNYSKRDIEMAQPYILGDRNIVFLDSKGDTWKSIMNRKMEIMDMLTIFPTRKDRITKNDRREQKLG